MAHDPHGEDICAHPNKVWRVSSHEDLLQASQNHEAHASIIVCMRNICVTKAKEWVLSIAADVEPVVIKLPRPVHFPEPRT